MSHGALFKEEMSKQTKEGFWGAESVCLLSQVAFLGDHHHKEPPAGVSAEGRSRGRPVSEVL